MRKTKGGVSRQKPDLNVVPDGWPGDAEWRNSLRREQEKLRQRQREILVPKSAEQAEQLVHARQDSLSGLAAKREEAFWNEAGFCFSGRNEPFITTKRFSAARCSATPSEETARQWFRVLAERDAVKQAVAKQSMTKPEVSKIEGRDPSPKKQISWGDVWKLVQKIELDYQVADFVWKEHCRWSSISNPWIVLRAWVLAVIKSDYLLPMLQRDQPGANRELLQNHLTVEVIAFSDRSPFVRIEVKQGGKHYKTVEVEQSMHFLRADLSVPDFVALPSRVAKVLQQALQQDQETVTRLLPKTRERLLFLNPSAGEPIDAVMISERNAEILAEIQTLPPRRRQAVELYLEGFPRQSIAAQMGIGEETVKTHLAHALEHLRFAYSASKNAL